MIAWAGALDAFFDQRRSILGSITAQALHVTGLPPERLHFNAHQSAVVRRLSHLDATPRLAGVARRRLGLDGEATPTFPSDRLLPPAHLCHGYSDDRKMMQIGQLAVVDDYSAPAPVLAHCLDGNQNGHPAIHETFLLARWHLALPDHMFLISDRGTHSLEHLVRLAQCRLYALVPRAMERLPCHLWKPTATSWTGNQPASCLLSNNAAAAQNQTCTHTNTMRSPLLRHQLIDPATKKKIRIALLFVVQQRPTNVSAANAGKKTSPRSTPAWKRCRPSARGHPQCTIASITRQVVQLLGKKDARPLLWLAVRAADASGTASSAAARSRPSPRPHTVSNSLSTPLPPKPRNNMTACPCS